MQLGMAKEDIASKVSKDTNPLPWCSVPAGEAFLAECALVGSLFGVCIPLAYLTVIVLANGLRER